MKYCYVCYAKCAGVRFPKDTQRLGAWLKSLGIGEVPKDHERICSDHFQETDF